MNRNLQLPLITKWFEMTKDEIKTEDYREINEYWVRRLFFYIESKLTIEEIVRYINYFEYYGYVNVDTILTYNNLLFKEYEFNVMTLGYPKATDKDRILILEHKGIEIRTGNPDWGAEPNKLYFVIKHGKKHNC